MQQSKAFLNGLKRCLKAKGVNYSDLAEHLCISQASVKRVFSEGTLTLDRIGAILDLCDLSFAQVAQASSTSNSNLKETLSFDQESVLASDEKLFAVFHLIIFGSSPEKIVESYVLSRQLCDRYIQMLKDVHLIDLRPNGQIKLLVGRNIQWQENGPLRKKYSKQIYSEFLEQAYSNQQESLAFTTRSLSESSISLIKRRIHHLMNEIKELANIDELSSNLGKKPCGLFIGFRPFTFSVIQGLKKRT